MKTLKEFISEIVATPTNSNRTIVSTVINGKSYQTEYQNTVNTHEGMVNDFAVHYYQKYQNKEI